MQNITFLDIETVSNYKNLPENLRELFIKKLQSKIQFEELMNGESVAINSDLVYKENAGLYAEFGKVVCICLGKLVGEKFYLKTICGKNEIDLLMKLSEALQKTSVLCAHNGLEFDFPFLYRRYIINGLPVPPILSIIGKKVWDVQEQLLDTMKMWSHLQWKHNISIELLAHLLGLPNPKEVLGGDKVGELYYSMFDVDVHKEYSPFEKEQEVLGKIGKYCASDTITLANVYARMRGFELIKEEQIEYV